MAGNENIMSLAARLDEHIEKCDNRHDHQDAKFDKLIDKLDQHIDSTQGLVEAWQTTRGLGKFGRWLGSVTVFGVSVGYLINKFAGG